MNDVKDVEALFGSRVFTRATMRERLPKNVYKEVIKAMDCGGELSPATADVVAKAMKDWAVENGATHYTHWFQPSPVLRLKSMILLSRIRMWMGKC